MRPYTPKPVHGIRYDRGQFFGHWGPYVVIRSTWISARKALSMLVYNERRTAGFIARAWR